MTEAKPIETVEELELFLSPGREYLASPEDFDHWSDRLEATARAYIEMKATEPAIREVLLELKQLADSQMSHDTAERGIALVDGLEEG
jgi:hypothetical protein